MPIPDRVQALDLDLTKVTRWSETTDVTSFYSKISPVVSARIEHVRLDSDPITGLDRLVVGLRLLDARFVGTKVWDSIDLSGMDGGQLMSFLAALGMPTQATRFSIRTLAMLERREVGLRVTTTKPIGSSTLRPPSRAPSRKGRRELFVVSGSYVAVM